MTLWGQLSGGLRIGLALETGFNVGHTINLHNEFALMQLKPKVEDDIGFWLGFSNSFLLR